jgi:uncharacterized cupredoxin-like copper-binding protein
MYQGKPFLAAVAAVFAVSFGTPAFAHGDGHAERKAIDYSKAEETTFGRAGDPAKVERTIDVAMDDSMHFTPGDIVVKRGATIRFSVHNNGRLMHEMVIGTMKELKEHAELMERFPGMEHDEPYMAHVSPGKREQLVWQFTRAGEFHYACLIPGHMEAGMTGRITVE